eukprot:616141-Hanusia_phi.AAC.3
MMTTKTTGDGEHDHDDVLTAEEAKPNSKKSSNKKGSRNKEELAKNLRKLADDAIKALADLDAPRTEAGKELEQATASKMQKII